MNIAMFTNTFLPHVGGVAQSVARFSASYRDLGHHVLVVAPWMAGEHKEDPDVIRIPAWEHAWKTDFSLPLPIPGFLSDRLDQFAPDVVHSHHPFLLGDTALRSAATHDVPIVFTNHTQYDVYTHYLPWESKLIKRFATRLAVGYANLCDAVVAPSESIRSQLFEAGVESRIEVIPTGIDRSRFGRGNGAAFREKRGIPSEAFLVGHVGRLATEKNLAFLAEAVAEFVAVRRNAWFFVAGEGPSENEFAKAFNRLSCADRLLKIGFLPPAELADAYAAMDAFAFASITETQGMVLVEAMAAGTPVVAIDAPGVRDLVRDGFNGALLSQQDRALFVTALIRLFDLPDEERRQMRSLARVCAEPYAMPLCATRAIHLYEQLIDDPNRRHGPHDAWHAAVRAIGQECQILSNVVDAGAETVLRS